MGGQLTDCDYSSFYPVRIVQGGKVIGFVIVVVVSTKIAISRDPRYLSDSLAQ